jgi:hypothetical protein
LGAWANATAVSIEIMLHSIGSIDWLAVVEVSVETFVGVMICQATCGTPQDSIGDVSCYIGQPKSRDD